MAKRRGVRGWHSMRKDQLVKALVKESSAKTNKARRSRTSPSPTASKTKKKTSSPRRAAQAKKNAPTRRSAPRGTATRMTEKTRGAVKVTASKAKTAKVTAPRIAKKIQAALAQRERLHNLSSQTDSDANDGPITDRVVLMVRDPYWLHACWQLSRASIVRTKAAMAELWHTARPVLRLMAVDAGTTTSTSHRTVREIEIHGGVRNWYIDVSDPPGSYIVEIGYAASDGKFYSLARSSVVTPPEPDTPELIDDNWEDVVANCEKVYALSGGYASDATKTELQDMFEERLQRPMDTTTAAQFGIGADRRNGSQRSLEFEVDADIVIQGNTKANAFVTLMGEPIKLREDGSFAVRMNMSNRRQVIPIVASSADGVEQQTIVLAIERNTKVMEPITREPHG